MSKRIERILTMVGLIFVAWFLISWVDVVSHNMGNGTSHAWNLFQILCGWWNG